MKNILMFFLQTVLFAVSLSLAKTLLNTTEDTFDGTLRSHTKYFDNTHPRNVQDETPGQYCLCSKLYDPICASNNESYFNLCYLECKVPKDENVTVIHQGNCIPYRK